MILTTHESAASFLQVAQAKLEEQEAANNLMLGICMRLHRRAAPVAPFLATVTGQRGLTLAAIMTPPHRLVLAGEGKGTGEALEMVGRALLAGRWSVPGVIGPGALAERFAGLWAEMAGTTARVSMRERVYRLDQVIPPPRPVPGRLRQATAADLDLVSRWTLGFNIDCFGRGELADAAELAERRIGEGEVYLWEDGEPVSMAARARPTRNGVTVNLVYTPPERRGQGYAGACVAALSGLLLDSGYRFCTLFADLDNPISNHIYRRTGYTPVCDVTEYVFGAAGQSG